jgi:hypothetical protein
MDQPLRSNHFVFGKGKKRGSLQEKTTPYISYLFFFLINPYISYIYLVAANQEINKISIYRRKHELMPKGEKESSGVVTDSLF